MIKSFISMVFFLLSITLIATAQDEQTSTSRWNNSDGSTEMSVIIRNDVQFNEDYTDVASINSEGFLKTREQHGIFTRELIILAGANDAKQ